LALKPTAEAQRARRKRRENKNADKNLTFSASSLCPLRLCGKGSMFKCDCFAVAQTPQIARLLMLENGFALVGKGGHAFLLVFECETGVENTTLEKQAFVETAFKGAIDRFLDHHDGR
jgi:hypothetical protein